MNLRYLVPALALTGCVVPPGASPPPTHRVVVVGDSVTDASRAQLYATIPDVDVDAIPGRGPDTNPFGGQTIRQAIQTKLPSVAPGGWLVVQDDGTPAISDEFVAWVASVLPDDRGLAWVSPDNWGQPADVEASTVVVRAGLPAQPIHNYIDWSQVRVTTPDLTKDGLHPNDAGANVLALLIKDATP